MLAFGLTLLKGGFRLQVEERLQSSGFTVIQGRSGCGKTTLLRCIAGLEPQAAGYVQSDDETWQSDRLWVPPHRRRLGYVPQEPTLFPNRTVRGNLEYGLKRAGNPKPDLAFNDVIEMLELSSLLQHAPAQLSGGQQQRVAIGRALLTSPRLLLMDEPLANLDQQSKQDILPYLDRLAADLALPVLYVTHSPQESARLANELVIMEGGRVLRKGPASELLTTLEADVSHRADSYARLNGTVARHDDEFGLTWVTVTGQELALHRLQQAPGSPVGLQVAARDVSIALTRASDTSIVNLVNCTIEGLAGDADPAYCIVRLRTGTESLLARISSLSAQRLALRGGMNVIAQIKAISL